MTSLTAFDLLVADKAAPFKKFLFAPGAQSLLQSAASVNLRQVAAILRRGVVVAKGLDFVSGVLGRLCNGAGRLAAQSVFHRGRPVGNFAHAGNAYSCVVYFAAGAADYDRDTNYRVAGSGVSKFLVNRSRASGLGHADFGDDLVWAQRGGEHTGEEAARWNHAFAGLAGDRDLRVQGKDRGRVISGRMRLGEAAADDAAVAHLDIANILGGLGQKRRGRVQDLGSGHGGMRGQG